MNSYGWIILSVIAGWCLKCIWDDWTLPFRAAALGGAATVTIDPQKRGQGPSAVEVAGLINAATVALNIMAYWLEEVQIANPRLPEECLTAQQWLESALIQAEKYNSSASDKGE